MYSFFYLIGILSLDCGDWFFKAYSEKFILLFMNFFSRNLTTTLVFNVALQAFVNFIEKNPDNLLLSINQSSFFNFFFNTIRENRFLFIKENALKAISASVICLKDSIQKENIINIIESLILTVQPVLKYDNYENFKSAVFETIFHTLQSLFKIKANELFNNTRLLNLLKVYYKFKKVP